MYTDTLGRIPERFFKKEDMTVHKSNHGAVIHAAKRGGVLHCNSKKTTSSVNW